MKMNQQQLSINNTYLRMNTKQKEFFELCSLADPNEQQIDQLTQIVSEDSIGQLNVVDEDGNSPLLLLCRNNHSASLIRCMKVLLMNNHHNPIEQGQHADGVGRELDVNYQDSKGFNALHYVCLCYEGDDLFEIIKLLVHHGIDINKTELEDDENALQLLLRYNKESRDLFEIIKWVIDQGVDLKHMTKSRGETALMYLCAFYNRDNLLDLVTLMIEKGVDVEAKDFLGNTPLLFVCQYYSHNNLIDLVRYFIEKGVDVNAVGCVSKDSYGWTALHILCRYYPHDNLIDLIRLLIEEGADTMGRTPEDSTVLHLLCWYYTHENLIELAKLLVKRGVDVKAKNFNGRTAIDLLHINSKHNNCSTNLVELLEGQQSACLIL